VIGSEQIVETVEQIEIDNSVESIIPMGVATEIVEGGEVVENTWLDDHM